MVSGVDVYGRRRVNYTWLGCHGPMRPAMTMCTGMTMATVSTRMAVLPMTLRVVVAVSGSAPAATGYDEMLRRPALTVGGSVGG
jgi:hypothetical protein